MNDHRNMTVPLILISTVVTLTISAASGLKAQTFAEDRGMCRGQTVCDRAAAAALLGPDPPTPSPTVRSVGYQRPIMQSDHGSAVSQNAPTTEKKRWSSFLPLMAEEAEKRGYQLPLPFGVSTVFTGLIDRKIEVTDVRIGVDGAAPRSVNQFFNLGSTSSVFNANLKVDAWLLPFLNLYLLAGYVYNESTTRATISVPRPGPIPGNAEFTTNITTKIEGFVGGGGMTLAGGYREFFLVADANYSQSDLGFDDRFKAIIATIRAGYQGKLGDLPLQMWVGQGYWNTTNTAKGHADVQGLGRIQFEADQGPTHPWMTDFGANLRLSRHFETVLDFGTDWHGGYLVVVAPTVRF
jgi:hypothetical protein